MWLDYIRRSLITGGELRRLIDEDGLRGDLRIRQSSRRPSPEASITARFSSSPTSGVGCEVAYERLAVQDIRDAADALRPVYDETSRRDGYVSLGLAASPTTRRARSMKPGDCGGPSGATI